MKFEEIDVKRILFPKFNAHMAEIDPPDLYDLADSIKALGLIQPIIVYTNSDNGYFVIDGKRRLRALHLLDDQYPGEGFDKVECVIHDIYPDDGEITPLSISVSNKITHEPFTLADMVHVCTNLWESYQSFKIIEKKFGISKKIIKKYVKYSWMSDSLKRAIEDGSISNDQSSSINAVRMAMDALNWTEDGDVSDDMIIELARAVTSKRRGNVVEKS